MNYKDKQRGALWLIQTLLVVLIVLWLFNPISENIYILAGLIIAWMGCTSIMYGTLYFGLYKLKRMAPMVMWILAMFFYALLGHVTFSMSYLMYFFCMGLGCFYLKVKDTQACKLVISVATIYLIIIEFSTLKAYVERPAISRLLAYGDVDKIISYGGGDYLTPFIGGYDIIYGLVLFCTALFGICFIKKTRHVWLWILSVVFAFLILSAQYFTAILLLVVGCLITFVQKEKKKSRRTVILLVLSFGLIFFLIIAPVIFNAIADMPAISNNISLRLRAVADFLSGSSDMESNYVGVRFEKYIISIKGLFNHILIGCGEDGLYINYGNHSTILDGFAKYGLIGGTAYICFFISPIKSCLLFMNDDEGRVYKSCLFVLLILAFVNRAEFRAAYAFVYIVIPMLVHVALQSRKEEQ